MQAITSMGGNPEQMLHAALAGAEGPVLTELRQVIGLIARLDPDMVALADSQGTVRHVLTVRLIVQYDRGSPMGPPDIGVPPPQPGVANAKEIVSKIADSGALIYPFLLALTRINQGAATVTERAPRPETVAIAQAQGAATPRPYRTVTLRADTDPL
jgi:hypothetical protein